MKLPLILILFCVTLGYASVLDFNLTAAVFKAFLTCGGNYVCNKNKYAFPHVGIESDEFTKLCPKCECDSSCHVRGDCCPDVFFELPESAYFPTFLLPHDPAEHDRSMEFLAVSKCPQDTDVKTSKFCEDPYSTHDILINLPVTSKTTNITYKSRHCAECNSDRNVIPWKWGVSCPRKDYAAVLSKFNYLSEITDVVRVANDTKCNIELSPEPDVHLSDLFKHPDGYISTCNLTGTWDSFDKDVASSCDSNYINFDGVYKNIFCRICNPPIPEIGTLVTKCNATGLLLTPDTEVEEACGRLPPIQGTGKYKNVFCFACNTGDDFGKKLDVEYGIKESVSQFKMKYAIGLSNIRKSYIESHLLDSQFPLNYYTMQDTRLYKHRTKSVIKRNGKTYNTTDILQYLFAYTSISLCNEYHIQERFRKYLVSPRTCSCDPTCLFSWKCDCCPDVGLTYPLSCLSDKVFSQEKENETLLLVTDGCYGKDIITSIDPEIEQLCINGQDTLSKVPVSDGRSDIQYKNIYCFLCNRDFDFVSTPRGVGIDMKYRFMPWDIELECNQNLDFKYTHTILDKIYLAQRLNCDIIWKPKSHVRTCQEHFLLKKDNRKWETTDRCNVSGTWTDNNQDLLWACEGLLKDNLKSELPFKNAYCSFCNPYTKSNEQHPMETCNKNITNPNYDPETEVACQTLPEVPTLYNYKNRFCLLCNHGVSSSSHYNGIPCECKRLDCGIPVIDGIPPTFRDVFMMNVVTHSLDQTNNDSSNRIFDHRTVSFMII